MYHIHSQNSRVHCVVFLKFGLVCEHTGYVNCRFTSLLMRINRSVNSTIVSNSRATNMDIVCSALNVLVQRRFVLIVHQLQEALGESI